LIQQILQALSLTEVTGIYLNAVCNPDTVNFYDSISVVDNTAVAEAPTHCDVIAAICGHAVMDKSDDETKTSTCEKVNTQLSQQRKL
jgi:hypothetical protein